MTSHARAGALICLSGVVAVTGVAAPAPAAAKKRKPTNVTCRLTLLAAVRQPAPAAANLATTKCNKGLGTGVQQDTPTVRRTSGTAGSFTGPFKMFFARGAINGTFAIDFVTMLAPATYAITGVVYKGRLKVTGGTGSYRRVRGTGTLTGFSPDAVKTQLTEKLKLTGL